MDRKFRFIYRLRNYMINATEGETDRFYKFPFIYIGQYIAPFICRCFGHKIIDCSSAGPESGNMDHYCSRCGAYWQITLY